MKSVVPYQGYNPTQTWLEDEQVAFTSKGDGYILSKRQHPALEVGDRFVRDAAMTEEPIPGDAQEWGPGRRTTEEILWDGGVRKDGAEHGYGVGGWEHTEGTFGFSITQINPLTLSLATSTSQQKRDWRISHTS